MIAFKGVEQDLTGRGSFQFEVGHTYKESECKCATNGFHCAENPLCCLTYYSKDDRFFIVKAEGDIDQDGIGTRISCTELTLVKEITLLQLAVYACQYIQKFPKRELESNYAVCDYGSCDKDFLIIKGKEPKGQGKIGSVLFFLEEDENGNIANITPIEIGDDGYKENTVYISKGGRIREERKN